MITNWDDCSELYIGEFNNDCLELYGELLTGANKHYCIDFDYLPIDDTCPEFEFCTCYKSPETVNG